MKIRTGLPFTFLALVMALPLASLGCQEAREPPTSPAVSNLSATLVPDMDLDVYIYLRQERPTRLSSETAETRTDIDIDSLAVWGVSTEEDFAFGGAITLADAGQAEVVQSKIKAGGGTWTRLSGNMVFLVHGSGTAAESLKKAITENNFKYYDDDKGLSAVSALPDGSNTRLAGVAIVKPSKPFIRYTFGAKDGKELELVNTIISTGRLEVAAAGLYAPSYIDVERLVGALESGADISTVELGILASVKSGLPGFLVEPTIEKLLTETDFAARSLDGLKIYHRTFDMEDAELTFLVRTDGNQIYGALSSNPSYAATLITGVNQ